MATNFDRPTHAGDRGSSLDHTEGRSIDEENGFDGVGGSADPGGTDETPRHDIEAACRSFEADERAAAERAAIGDRREREPERGRVEGQDWNAVGVVTSLGMTCLFGVGGVLARSTQLTTAASVAFVAVGVLLARRGRRWWE